MNFKNYGLAVLLIGGLSSCAKNNDDNKPTPTPSNFEQVTADFNQLPGCNFSTKQYTTSKGELQYSVDGKTCQLKTMEEFRSWRTAANDLTMRINKLYDDKSLNYAQKLYLSEMGHIVGNVNKIYVGDSLEKSSSLISSVSETLKSILSLKESKQIMDSDLKLESFTTPEMKAFLEALPRNTKYEENYIPMLDVGQIDLGNGITFSQAISVKFDGKLPEELLKRDLSKNYQNKTFDVGVYLIGDGGVFGYRFFYPTLVELMSLLNDTDVVAKLDAAKSISLVVIDRKMWEKSKIEINELKDGKLAILLSTSFDLEYSKKEMRKDLKFNP